LTQPGTAENDRGVAEEQRRQKGSLTAGDRRIGEGIPGLLATFIDPLLNRGDTVSPDGIRRLHPSGIEGPEQIRALLERLRVEKVALQRGMNRRIDPEIAWIDRVDGTDFVLRTQNLEKVRRFQLFLNFSLDGRSYFLAAPVLQDDGTGTVHLELPTVVYRAERRDRSRHEPQEGEATRVAVTAPARDEIRA
jgi:hypothetical protein